LPLEQEDWKDVTPLTAAKYHKLHGHFRRLEGMNNVLQNGSPLLKSMKKAIESGKIKRLLAFDVEAFEHDQKFLLELGAAVYEISPNCSTIPSVDSFHFVMKENVKKKNGKFCANNRDNYSFGTSKFLPTNEVFNWLRSQLKKPGTGIIGHNIAADLRYLEQAKNFKNTGARFPVPCDTPFNQRYFKGLPIFDTQAIFREVHLRPHEEKLEKLLMHYGIPHEYLHNAGNDAYFTMMTALKLVGLPFKEFTGNGGIVEKKMGCVGSFLENEPSKKRFDKDAKPNGKRSNYNPNQVIKEGL
jgi:DNA polymerase III epsilon subunit-like protein